MDNIEKIQELLRDPPYDLEKWYALQKLQEEDGSDEALMFTEAFIVGCNDPKVLEEVMADE